MGQVATGTGTEINHINHGIGTGTAWESKENGGTSRILAAVGVK